MTADATTMKAANWQAWAIGEKDRRGRFKVRRVVWGRVMARAEKRPGETIRKCAIFVVAA